MNDGVARADSRSPATLLTAESPPANAVKKKSGISIGGRKSSGFVTRLCSRRQASPPATERVAPHVRAILSFRPSEAKVRPIARMPSAQPKPSASASPSQPVISRLRRPSTM